MTKIVFLSISLLFAPLLSYNLASAETSTNSSTHKHLHEHLHEHQNISDNHDSKHHSLTDDHSKCYHQDDENCGTSCCVSIVLITPNSQITGYKFIHPNYFNTFMQIAESCSIDNQLRPPQST